MTLLIVGLIVFLGVHSIAIVAPGARSAAVARIGEGPWKGIYSLLSLAGFYLLVVGYGEARLQPQLLYAPPAWTRHVAYLLMLPVFVMLIAAYVPSKIKATLKHPMLAAVKLWAVAHLIANGTLADVLLFGGFLVWAVIDRISVKRRGAPPPVAPDGVVNDLVVVVVGLAIYAGFVFYGHAWLIGVPLVAP